MGQSRVVVSCALTACGRGIAFAVCEVRVTCRALRTMESIRLDHFCKHLQEQLGIELPLESMIQDGAALGRGGICVGIQVGSNPVGVCVGISQNRASSIAADVEGFLLWTRVDLFGEVCGTSSWTRPRGRRE